MLSLRANPSKTPLIPKGACPLPMPKNQLLVDLTTKGCYKNQRDCDGLQKHKAKGSPILKSGTNSKERKIRAKTITEEPTARLHNGKRGKKG